MTTPTRARATATATGSRASREATPSRANGTHTASGAGSAAAAREPGARSRFLRGVAGTLAIVAGFAALGLAAGALGAHGAGPRGVPLAPDDYTDAMSGAPAEPRVWLVDGYNALHVGVLREGGRGGAWWSASGRESLLERVRRFEGGAAAVWVVFDGPDPRELLDPGAPEGAEGRARLVFAPSADEWLLARAREAEPGAVAVVTADRRLAARARARGATVISPREFLARCGSAGATPEQPTPGSEEKEGGTGSV